MTRHLLLPAILLLSACDRNPPPDLANRRASLETATTLAPQDLGIEKRRFRIVPGPGQVAVFRSKQRSRLETFDRRAYDQIQWTNGKEAVQDVVIAPLSFYLGTPKPKDDAEARQFRDSWRLRAGGFGCDIDEYTFVRSGWSTSQERLQGKVIYTKDIDLKTEDLVFEFEMFVISLDDAVKLYPDLDLEEQKKYKDYWKISFLAPENEEGPSGGSGEPKAPGDSKR